MKVLVLDNYDSFTYNLVQYIEEELEQEIDVFRNDEIKLEDVGRNELSSKKAEGSICKFDCKR